MKFGLHCLYNWVCMSIISLGSYCDVGFITALYILFTSVYYITVVFITTQT